MSGAVSWPDTMLRDIVEASRISLGRVSAHEIDVTPQATNWRLVQDWITEVERSLSGTRTDGPMRRVAPFPLTGRELRALQVAVDEIV
ncbi:MAG TPA: hypothetical protein VGN32_15180, partial [Ktedonobacterales bacterium]|nr:hypothetical protein [Ktedonobacterales bacterium]